MESLVEKKTFGGIYNGRRVLVTGHTGFKGTWLVTWLQMLGADVAGFSIDSIDNGRHYNILNPAINSVFGNVLDAPAVNSLISEFRPEIVFHLAAQSLVRRSYRKPVDTYMTNLIGTLNVYEACRNCDAVKVLISVTSDKVYENKESYAAYKEDDPLGGYDMYSSSKACVELMTNSYRNSFLNEGKADLKLVTARAGNVIGGGDWAEDRLVPDIFRAIEAGKSVTIRSPKAIRPWQHVLEPLSGYLLLGQKLFEGVDVQRTAFNFGPAAEKFVTVEELVAKIAEIEENLSYEILKSDLHEAGILTVDSENAAAILDWSPVWDAGVAIARTANWYREFVRSGKALTVQDIVDYNHQASSKTNSWAR